MKSFLLKSILILCSVLITGDVFGYSNCSLPEPIDKAHLNFALIELEVRYEVSRWFEDPRIPGRLKKQVIDLIMSLALDWLSNPHLAVSKFMISSGNITVETPGNLGSSYPRFLIADYSDLDATSRGAPERAYQAGLSIDLNSNKQLREFFRSEGSLLGFVVREPIFGLPTGHTHYRLTPNEIQITLSAINSAMGDLKVRIKRNIEETQKRMAQTEARSRPLEN